MYNHIEIEKKWQKFWEENQTFKTDTNNLDKPKYYVLDMFPYPSGQGLHVGHLEGYSATDIIARKKRMEGFNVLHPIGWDSFGLPAEQYAINTGNHPQEFTIKNINNFRRQIKAAGLSYDFDREVTTSSPEYYKWTQWIFTKLYEKGLAYVDNIPVNWCEELKTVLSNEEVIDGRSERGNYPVIRKPMRQWVLKITEYAQRLLDDLDLVDWPNSTKEMQINWIGKSEGALIDFKIANHDKIFTVFTTRADTLFGATYCVLAPEHPFVLDIVTPEMRSEVEAYIKECAKKSDLARTDLNKDKTGVFIGAYAINPVNNRQIPIYIADYVLSSYGTGAIMAVPAHDQRDYEFAKKYNIDIIPVIENADISEMAMEAEGIHVNSEFLNGLNNDDAKKVMIKWLEDNGLGVAKTTFKLRDWLFSRQRYWGEPIPIIHLADGTMKTVDIEQLPLELPVVDDYVLKDGASSPLNNNPDWVNIIVDGQPATRETNTMPQWAGSCWYYLRYIDPLNDQKLADEKLLEHWLPVDLYVGGAEHAVLHLLYARFWHKVLYDLGVVNTKEPFKKLFHQGMILGENNEKMSKSRGNVINPDEIFISHGADALRTYEMFMGPLEASLPWKNDGLDGIKRWLERIWRLIEQKEIVDDNNGQLDYHYNLMIKKVSHDIDTLNFNTAISQMMIFVNECYKQEQLYRPYVEGFILVLSTFAPHLGEELWQILGHNESLAYHPWPSYDEKMLVLDEKEVVVQVNGKVRGRFTCDSSLDDETLYQMALEIENVKNFINGQTIKKHFVIKNKLVNIVI